MTVTTPVKEIIHSFDRLNSTDQDSASKKQQQVPPSRMQGDYLYAQSPKLIAYP